MRFSRRSRQPDALGPQQPWDTRTIVLVGDRAEADRICGDWTSAGWQVMTVDESAPTATGLPTHTVRVAVPPTGCAVEVSAPR